MNQVAVVLLGLSVLPGVLPGQNDVYSPARFNWTTINAAVLPDSTGGVMVWFISSRSSGADRQFQYFGRFVPKDVLAWTRQVGSLLASDLPIADTIKWPTPPTLASPGGALLGWQRVHERGKWQGRVGLVFYPAPDSNGKENEPLDLDMALSDAREFLDTMASKAALSRYVPDTARHLIADASQVQEKPEALSGPPPRYPESLRQKRVEGDVWIEVIVDTLGRPEPRTLKVLVSADPLFEVEARRTILGTRFKPGRVGGKPVRVLVMLPVRFRLAP